jgi:hypothetical protein
MQARYSEHIQAKGRVIIAGDFHVNEGRILNLTVPGCLLESPLCMNKGDSIKLKLFLPGLHSPFSVELAVVRWINGFQFGVEFIKMGEGDQRLLHQFIAQDRADQVLKKKGTRQQFSDPGGQNWHLESYSLAGKETGSVL